MPIEIAHYADGQHECRHRDEVGIDDPLLLREARVQVITDLRQQNVDDGDVDEDRAGGEDAGVERSPLAKACQHQSITAVGDRSTSIVTTRYSADR